ncbi:hypothetical protein [Sulfurimonas sp.]|jgi:cell division protein FtsZ|uniref:hypothetical protein n=1 Tax=Sulfurimonas sp. TaxID=2022749 RepID=UPI0025EFE2BE|nr:hypothetical protein [Sulfurimonas sp.]MBT5934866.1 hypothetical protein [Sulfurimonas sp.]
MRKLTQEELEQEFNKIIALYENDINLDREDLKILIESSFDKIYYYARLKIKIDTNNSNEAVLAIKELKNLNNHKMCIIHFSIHPDCSLHVLGNIIEIISDTADEEVEMIYGTTSDKNYPLDYVEVKIYAA